MLDEKVVEVMYLTNFTIPVHDKLSKRDLRARNKETVSSAFINIQHWYKAVLILILNIEQSWHGVLIESRLRQGWQ